MRLIDADELIKALEVIQYNDIDDLSRTEDLIDNAPTVDAIPNSEGYEMYNKGYMQGYERGKAEARPQGEYVDISKLRLMTVEECAGHTIDYAMGWKACVEWIKKGGAE
jgi:hypothetical protein